jgi:hypothetical protein
MALRTTEVSRNGTPVELSTGPAAMVIGSDQAACGAAAGRKSREKSSSEAL